MLSLSGDNTWTCTYDGYDEILLKSLLEVPVLRQTVARHVGGVWVPRIQNVETLQAVVQEFAQSVRSDREPMTDGYAGRHVVELTRHASASLQADGHRRMVESVGLPKRKRK